MKAMMASTSWRFQASPKASRNAWVTSLPITVAMRILLQQMIDAWSAPRPGGDKPTRTGLASSPSHADPPQRPGEGADHVGDADRGGDDEEVQGDAPPHVHAGEKGQQRGDEDDHDPGHEQ